MKIIWFKENFRYYVFGLPSRFDVAGHDLQAVLLNCNMKNALINTITIIKVFYE